MDEQTVNDIQEEWKIASGYPNYEVSHIGRVRYKGWSNFETQIK